MSSIPDAIYWIYNENSLKNEIYLKLLILLEKRKKSKSKQPRWYSNISWEFPIVYWSLQLIFFFFFFLSWYPSFRFSSFLLKGALESLRPFLMTESPLKMMKNAFYFTLKALFVFKIFKFLLWLFGHVQKTARLERYVNFKTHDVTTWLTNNFNTHITQYLKK